MGKVEKSIKIRAQPEKVWEMLALDRLPEWDENYENVEYASKVNTPEDKYRVGSVAHATHKQGEWNLDITESFENKKIMYALKGKTALIVTSILEPVENGTKLTLVGDYIVPWGIFGKFLENLFLRRQSEKSMETALEKLKGILEK